ncbi:hypothetical protein [Streptomyces cinerochromogenes]|uniref:hypothetical protein n=1 Tax=Streptomyces cinerochromogenes TaxID=66422 RepID=UPI0019A850E1|nr:hypothetical protein [Streptomyces cinerochromogenes]GGS90536.1 hypothetical protein GCM10010206_61650 [Streptomyces cinerochromogenes]
MTDINWDLGRFGKLHVRHGKGARGSGPRERMVPLINGADRTLRWFIEDVWGQFDDDRTRPGAPLFSSERRCADGSSSRVGDDALRGGLKAAAMAHPPGWGDMLLMEPAVVLEVAVDVARDAAGRFRHPARPHRIRTDIGVEQEPVFGEDPASS